MLNRICIVYYSYSGIEQERVHEFVIAGVCAYSMLESMINPGKENRQKSELNYERKTKSNDV